MHVLRINVFNGSIEYTKKYLSYFSRLNEYRENNFYQSYFDKIKFECSIIIYETKKNLIHLGIEI